MNCMEKARKFIYRNARPIELARWQYHFESATKETVLNILETYQNADGGFGHGLEPDYFNPNSSPIQTWAATEILKEINITDKNTPIIKGILRYLSSGLDFNPNQKQWKNRIASNNDYPHAVWWTYEDNNEDLRYNPTASLAGFILKYGEKECEIYKKAVNIVHEAYEYFMKSDNYLEHHITACYIQLYEYCVDANYQEINMEAFRLKLIEQVNKELLGKSVKWGKEYVCKPSNLLSRKQSFLYEGLEEIISEECNFIIDIQEDDGSYAITWQWWTDYKEFELAKNWWKSDICIKNMLFLKEFSS